MRDTRDYALAALGAALVFCLGLLVGRGTDVLPAAHAQDGTIQPGQQPEPGPPGPQEPTRTVPIRPGAARGGGAQTDSNSNNRFVAVTAPDGSGESVLYLLDSENDQLLVYRYLRFKGLQLMAGRKIDFDLKLSAYKDASEYTRDQLKTMFTKERSKSMAKAAKKR